MILSAYSIAKGKWAVKTQQISNTDGRKHRNAEKGIIQKNVPYLYTEDVLMST